MCRVGEERASISKLWRVLCVEKQKAMESALSRTNSLPSARAALGPRRAAAGATVWMERAVSGRSSAGITRGQGSAQPGWQPGTRDLGLAQNRVSVD